MLIEKIKTNKKAASEVIGSVLLIVLVIVIAGFVFFWIRGILKDKVVTYQGENIDLVCNKLKFNAEYVNGTVKKVVVSNLGNIAINDFLVKKIEPGKTKNFNLKDYGFFETLEPGESASVSIQMEVVNSTGNLIYQELNVIPILIGTSDSGKKEYVCKDSVGQEVLLS